MIRSHATVQCDQSAAAASSISDVPLDRLLGIIESQREPGSKPTSETLLAALLRDAWRSMTVAQKLQWLNSPSVGGQLLWAHEGDESAARTELQHWRDTLYGEIHQMRVVVEAAGYQIVETHAGLSYWERDGEASEDFHGVSDTVADAYAHWVQHQPVPVLSGPGPRG